MDGSEKPEVWEIVSQESLQGDVCVADPDQF